MIKGNYEEKLSREIMRRNYHRKLCGEIIKGNYEEKLSQEIMRRNYHSKLSASIYQHTKNVGIIGILAYPKIKSKRKRGNRFFVSCRRTYVLNNEKYLKIKKKYIFRSVFIKCSDQTKILRYVLLIQLGQINKYISIKKLYD